MCLQKKEYTIPTPKNREGVVGLCEISTFSEGDCRQEPVPGLVVLIRDWMGVDYHSSLSLGQTHLGRN
jgi:hypothetical protein